MGICGAYEARQNGAAWGTTHLLSIHRQGVTLRTMGGIPGNQHLVLTFDDTEDETAPDAPTLAHVETVCQWIDTLPGEARLLVHCQQGMNRSTAIGLGVLARYMPPENAGAALHAIRPIATPNKLMVRQWDKALELHGALSRIARRYPCRKWRVPKPPRGSGE